jgi:hypothetical protein
MNKIEDKYVDNMLVERRVNGFVEPVGQIQNDRVLTHCVMLQSCWWHAS